MPEDKVSPEGKSVKANGREKRSTPRVPVNGLPVEIYDTDGLTILGVGHIDNLGVNCAGLDTTINLTKNQEFFLRFLVEKKYLVNVWVKVARIITENQKKYYGVQFSRTDILHQHDLKDFLAKKLKE